MSSLIAVGFDDEFTAEAVMLELRKLQQEHLIDLEDAAIAIRNKEGKVRIKQTQELTAAGALSGGFWGLLFGFIFFNPLLGWAVGAVAGGLSGAFTDIGIDDNFIREIGNTITPGTSAIFVLVRKATSDKVLEDLSKFKGKVLKTSLSNEDEAKLQAVLAKA
ncbi:DUF1269 domain-containing protein [Pseudanabaena sp. FACHB-1998]|uniref:DUF1269 domain-containing protein n=1 Tax=Pseudanabaena sp. FACHB-1998 TaxID=2692858 RepID=UPI0016805DB8|nr:DUF1269 domain-containing protein [Pseudanabaena sp. FACHB-1998]MBD2178619.1 DUF1269 domain-containing protein [Pseudanabaena sp. FACHB-1998]